MNHGPIDLILWAEGGDVARAYRQAIARFDGLLAELVSELPILRSHCDDKAQGSIALAMQRAVDPHRTSFITPMAAVAGAVADEILAAMTREGQLTRAYVNNGGDIAVHLTADQSLTAAIAARFGAPDRVTLHHTDSSRGVATSGWRGRSFSFGIADAVTVIARTAAEADAAATMIANSVNLPDHSEIVRKAANLLQADTDLGDMPVTVNVPKLSADEISIALASGANHSRQLIEKGVIAGAALFLQSVSCVTGQINQIKEPPFV